MEKVVEELHCWDHLGYKEVLLSLEVLDLQAVVLELVVSLVGILVVRLSAW